MDYKRLLRIDEIEDDSIFLWGPRQVGKSTQLKKLFPEAVFYDLLKSDVYERLQRRPSILREEIMALPKDVIVIIDEVQKIPEILDEVHWLICNHGTHFILCGSSARKLKAVGTNLLGGRALKSEMYPLVSREVDDFDLLKAINNGMIPRHYLAENPKRRLQAYVGVYLEEEIRREAQLRNLNAFTRFLEVAAGCNGEIVNYTNIARDCGVSANTVKGYFEIISQTLVGFMLPAFSLSKKRRVISMPKFYYFDVGIANYLRHWANLRPGSIDFGHAFEHFIIQEIRAWLGYNFSDESMTYWHTSNGDEVDCVIGNGRVTIEIKSTDEVQPRHLKGLKVFSEEFPSARLIVVSMDKEPRILTNVEILPATHFLQMLWKEGL